jgi:hypothetical protein
MIEFTFYFNSRKRVSNSWKYHASHLNLYIRECEVMYEFDEYKKEEIYNLQIFKILEMEINVIQL